MYEIVLTSIHHGNIYLAYTLQSKIYLFIVTIHGYTCEIYCVM